MGQYYRRLSAVVALIDLPSGASSHPIHILNLLNRRDNSRHIVRREPTNQAATVAAITIASVVAGILFITFCFAVFWYYKRGEPIPRKRCNRFRHRAASESTTSLTHRPEDRAQRSQHRQQPQPQSRQRQQQQQQREQPEDRQHQRQRQQKREQRKRRRTLLISPRSSRRSSRRSPVELPGSMEPQPPPMAMFRGFNMIIPPPPSTPPSGPLPAPPVPRKPSRHVRGGASHTPTSSRQLTPLNTNTRPRVVPQEVSPRTVAMPTSMAQQTPYLPLHYQTPQHRPSIPQSQQGLIPRPDSVLSLGELRDQETPVRAMAPLPRDDLGFAQDRLPVSPETPSRGGTRAGAGTILVGFGSEGSGQGSSPGPRTRKASVWTIQEDVSWSTPATPGMTRSGVAHEEQQRQQKQPGVAEERRRGGGW